MSGSVFSSENDLSEVLFLEPLISLQWFAAEDEGRTEEPTEHKLREAREKEGRVPKSQEIPGALVLLLPTLCLIMLAPWLFRNCVDLMSFCLQRCTTAEIDGTLFLVFMRYFSRIILPVLGVAILAGIVGNVVQNRGFIFSLKPITPSFSKILPKFGEYFKKTLFSLNGAFNIVKSIAKVAILVLISYNVIKGNLPNLVTLLNVNLWQGIVYLGQMIAKLLIMASVVFLVIAIPDYLMQRRQFMEQMKMSKQEVKEEFKNLEGDPFVKGRLRQYMRQLMTQQMRQNVANADVVITNPTHYAVALQYDRESMQAPMVTAKGVDELAQRIKEIARQNDVEIVENRPLARALYAQVEIGDIIPEEFYSALSLILQRVYRLKGKL